MLTFFTTAKAFEGLNGLIQRNALRSWKLLDKDVEVILFGDDAGAMEACAELGLRHEPRVERHESGMKYLSYMVRRAREIAKHKYLCYSNCDIVQMREFGKAIERARAWREDFLLVARRWDTDLTAEIDFGDADWEHKLRQTAIAKGKKQSADFIDYFVFPKDFCSDVSPALIAL